MKVYNPFFLKGYYSPVYFCNRDRETEIILKAMLSGRDITLQSIRRMGKTGLLKHIEYLLNKNHKIPFIYLDIQHTENLGQFTHAVGNALLKVLAPKKNTLEWIKTLFKSVSPAVSYDSITGNPEITFKYNNQQQVLSTLNDIVVYLQNYGQRLVIAIDEFQQITSYAENNTESVLRSHFQHLDNVSFIYSGSVKHLLLNIFTLPASPFYQSTQLINLGEIAEVDYVEFVLFHFKKAGRTISEEQIKRVLALCFGHTWYVQMMFNRIFETEKVVSDTGIDHALEEIIKEFEFIYSNYRNLLTAAQWKLLKAIAHEEKVYSHNAANFIYGYNLSSSAAVNRALQSLKGQDMICQETDENQLSFYRLNDVFLMRFIQTYY